MPCAAYRQRYHMPSAVSRLRSQLWQNGLVVDEMMPIVVPSGSANRSAGAELCSTIGIISSTTSPFCQSCDRSRLTADGMWYLCLYAAQGIDLRAPLRRGAAADELAAIIGAGWQQRSDRGAEQRLELRDRRAFVPVTSLKRDPHLEMHTRGG